jgi:TPP-dependent pyruvate/acetoin dehydrogenase alpha subunit
MKNITAQQLIEFEQEIAELFKEKKIHCPIHLSGGNEEQLIEIFKEVKPGDIVFSTHRNHYHYLLHSGNFGRLKDQILKGDSMHTCDCWFYSSSIVAGCVSIAAGMALALKMKGSTRRVWCFIGDGATDEGWVFEAVRFAHANDLPIKYIVEDNNRSVESDMHQRWGGHHQPNFESDKVMRYEYKCAWPHCGCGEWVTF